MEALCDRCGSAFRKLSSRHRFCASCGPIAELERSRERMRERRASEPLAMKQYQLSWLAANRARVRTKVKERNRRLGIRQIGDFIACAQCGCMIPNAGPGHKFCDGCGESRRIHNNRVRASIWGKKNKERRNAYLRERFSKNPRVRLNSRMSNAIGESLRTGKSAKSWADLVPYSLNELMRHLERQFLPGMNWSNMSDWHIDHIVPLAAFQFDRASDAGFKAAWSITNLRPFWRLENIRKNAQRLYLI